jgi:hypothetical protein
MDLYFGWLLHKSNMDLLVEYRVSINGCCCTYRSLSNQTLSNTINGESPSLTTGTSYSSLYGPWSTYVSTFSSSSSGRLVYPIQSSGVNDYLGSANTSTTCVWLQCAPDDNSGYASLFTFSGSTTASAQIFALLSGSLMLYDKDGHTGNTQTMYSSPTVCDGLWYVAPLHYYSFTVILL